MELDLAGSNIRISDDINSWEEVNLLYNSALKQITTKIEILNEEFQEVHRYNPIEHTKARLKSPESIVKKLRRNGLAGVRILKGNILRRLKSIAKSQNP